MLAQTAQTAASKQAAAAPIINNASQMGGQQGGAVGGTGGVGGAAAASGGGGSWDPAETIEVELTRGSESLGINISKEGEVRIYSITPNGVADRDGRLRVGDVLRAVNGKPWATHATHDEVIRAIRESGETVALTLSRKRAVPDAALPKVNNNDKVSMMSEVLPCMEWCCGYCALTPSIACSNSCQVLCCNYQQVCCQEAQEGCICQQNKCWLNCTRVTLCKVTCGYCCLVGACAVPCHIDIPCRLTLCYCTLCPPCGGCRKVNHAKVCGGVRGAPQSCEMER